VKIDLKRFKIEKAARKDGHLPTLNGVYFDPEDAVLVAGDGYGLAVVPIREVGLDDDAGMIPAEAIQLARASQGKSPDAELSANGNVTVGLRGKPVEFARESSEGFPDWSEQMKTSGRPVATFILSPKTLQNVADALGSGLVKLELHSGGKAKVSPVYWDDEYPMPRGVIMTQTVEAA
jgi:hypothetical protein